MEFRVQMDGLRFVVADMPEQRKEFESGQLRTDAEGRPLFQARLLAMDGAGSAPIKVGLIGDPGLEQGVFVRPVGLVLNTIDRRGDTVTWWTAERLEPDGPVPADGPGGKPGGTGKAAAGKAGE
ncbi:hypothetical protein [Actinomadura sp. 9N407]|uniref:hypothetical protein n=1 Tax=Actinomadura sp. 9N407 TaxID=3375154 RepID=UPI0037AF6920